MNDEISQNKMTIRYLGIPGLIEESTQEIDLSKIFSQSSQSTATIEEFQKEPFLKLMRRWLELTYSEQSVNNDGWEVTVDDEYINNLKSYFKISQEDISKLESMKGKTYSIYPTGIGTLSENAHENENAKE